MFEEHSPALSGEGFRTKCFLERLVVDAASLLSRLSLSKGDLAEATYFAKSAVKLSCRAWARLDRYARKKRDTSGSNNTEQDVDIVTNRIASIELSSDSATAAQDYYRGSIFWPHLESHYSALVRLSRIAVVNGLFQDAIYYGEQALEIGKSIGSKCFVSLIKAELGKYHVCAGQLQKGGDLLSEAVEESESNGVDKHLNTILLDLHKSTRARHADELEDEHNALALAYQTLSDISWNGCAELLDPFSEAAIADIEGKVKDLSIAATSNRGRQSRTQIKSSRGKRVENGNSRAKKAPNQEARTVVESPLFSNIRGDILHRQAVAAMSVQDLTRVGLLLDKASDHALSPLGQVNHCLISSEYQLATAIQKLSSHEVYCVLRESTISLPSIHAGGAAINEERCVSSNRKTRATTSKRKANRSAQSPRKSAPVSRDEFSPLLSRANDYLKSVSVSAAQHNSTTDNHNVSFLMGRISMLSHATDVALKHGATPDICNPAYGTGK